MSLAEYRQLNTRKASIVHVGGFRPTGDPLASNFGLKPVVLPGEAWPDVDGEPLLFVCQLNLTTAPFIPPLLQDIALLTFFVEPDTGDLEKESGDNWCLRTYSTLTGLSPLARPAEAPRLEHGFECRWEAADDQPNYDDPDLVVPEGFDDSEVDLENLTRTKIGGYASSIQSEPWWCTEKHPCAPVYALQINSEEKVGLCWGDAGTVYLARGTAPQAANRWFLDWQCY